MPWWARRWFRWSEWRHFYARVIGYFVRGRRGWADHDTWGLDHYLAGVLAGALRHLATTKHGFPPDFLPADGQRQEYTKAEVDAAFEAWLAWLRDKADWFEWYRDDEDGTSDDKGWILPGLSGEERRRRIDAYTAKMARFHDVVLVDFVKHWGDLWD